MFKFTALPAVVLTPHPRAPYVPCHGLGQVFWVVVSFSVIPAIVLAKPQRNQYWASTKLYTMSVQIDNLSNTDSPQCQHCQFDTPCINCFFLVRRLLSCGMVTLLPIVCLKSRSCYRMIRQLMPSVARFSVSAPSLQRHTLVGIDCQRHTSLS